MIYQRYALDGERLDSYSWVELPQILSDITETLYLQISEEFQRGLYHCPVGLTGVNMSSGLVKVKLTNEKVCEMKFGKYLRHVGANEDTVREASGRLSAAIKLIKGAELKFTTTSEEVLEVYRNGPQSCMVNSESTAVYATEDVAVAYVKVGGRILARSVVCINEDLDKHYVRIYGNGDLIQPLLEAQGFSDTGDLEGCKLKRIENDNGQVLLPYIDVNNYAEDCGDHILIHSSGDHDIQNESGILGNTHQCDGCEESMSDDESNWCDFSNSHLCESCYNENHVIIGCESYHVDSDEIVMINWSHYLKEDCEYMDRHGEYGVRDDIEYANYSDEWVPAGETVLAIVCMHSEPETCVREDCTKSEHKPNTWVHDDLIELYDQQLVLELEDNE